MMSDSLRQYYLQQMGIETWVRRNTRAQEAVSDLTHLKATVSTCTRCPLYKTRTHTVFARGDQHAPLMVIGAAPSAHEDRQGLPFVGKAGQLLNRMLHSIGLLDNAVYVANVLKCSPPNDREPERFEIEQCSDYLAKQIELIKPTLLLAVGCFSGHYLMNETMPLESMRNQVHDHRGTPFVVSYHPAYLLSNPSDKKKAYQDLLFVDTLLKRL